LYLFVLLAGGFLAFNRRGFVIAGVLRIRRKDIPKRLIVVNGHEASAAVFDAVAQAEDGMI